MDTNESDSMANQTNVDKIIFRIVFKIYKAAPNIVAIIFITGTNYDCNVDNKGDLIWMQYQFPRGLNMLAISHPKRNIYACNLFHKGPNKLAIIENLFSRDSSRNHSHVILGRFSTLQAYIVRFGFEIATCKHI